jgi:hypothetical protein
MRFPGRKELAANDTYAGVARGQQVTADTTRAGVVDDGNIAWPERIEQARRSWPQARAEDFEKIASATTATAAAASNSSPCAAPHYCPSDRKKPAAPPASSSKTAES